MFKDPVIYYLTQLSEVWEVKGVKEVKNICFGHENSQNEGNILLSLTSLTS